MNQLSNLYLRIYQHLLPQAVAWRVETDKMLRRWWLGCSAWPSAARDFIDRTWRETFPAYTTELDRWEQQFGLVPASTEAARRLQLAGAWAAQGGQSPAYLQSVVRAAGFDVYLHEWWQPGGPPWVARDPRPYTTTPKLGTVQCGDTYAKCTANNAPLPGTIPGDVAVTDLYPQCNRFLMNDPGYLVNENLTRNAPPAIPDSASFWPYFLYWGGETFGTKAAVPRERKDEFERLLLKICPAHCWLVLLIDYGQWVVGDEWLIGTPGLFIGQPPP